MYCPSCGSATRDDATSCGHCGNWLESSLAKDPRGKVTRQAPLSMFPMSARYTP